MISSGSASSRMAMLEATRTANSAGKIRRARRYLSQAPDGILTRVEIRGEQPGDQVARDHEEDIDTDEPAGQRDRG